MARLSSDDEIVLPGWLDLVAQGQQERSGSMFSYVSIEQWITASHPLRRIHKLADQALDRLNPTFCALHASEGRPSVPPEMLLQVSSGSAPRGCCWSNFTTICCCAGLRA